MKTKVIIGVVIVLVVLFVLGMLLIVPRSPAQDITVRHISSVQSANVTRLAFKIKNHTAAQYIFSPSEVQVRNKNGWSKFQDFNSVAASDLTGVVWYEFEVTNLPPGSVRFTIHAQKILLGVHGFVKRAEFNLRNLASGGKLWWIPLNPDDQKNKVYALPIEISSDEWVESAAN